MTKASLCLSTATEHFGPCRPDMARERDAAAHQTYASLAKGRPVPVDRIDELVELVLPDPKWADVYAAEAGRIQHAKPLEIEAELHHIGSTAVSGMPGKPIIDIMIGLERLEQVERLVEILECLGYESLNEAGVPGRWALSRPRKIYQRMAIK